MASPWRVAIALTTGDRVMVRCRSEDEARNVVNDVIEGIETNTCPVVTHHNAEGQCRTTAINPAHIVDVWCYKVSTGGDF